MNLRTSQGLSHVWHPGSRTKRVAPLSLVKSSTGQMVLRPHCKGRFKGILDVSTTSRCKSPAIWAFSKMSRNSLKHGLLTCGAFANLSFPYADLMTGFLQCAQLGKSYGFWMASGLDVLGMSVGPSWLAQFKVRGSIMEVEGPNKRQIRANKLTENQLEKIWTFQQWSMTMHPRRSMDFDQLQATDHSDGGLQAFRRTRSIIGPKTAGWSTVGTTCRH